MGWLGYTETETLDTTMPALIRAYEGKLKMLRACFGGAEETKPKPAPETISVGRVESMIRALAGGGTK